MCSDLHVACCHCKSKNGFTLQPTKMVRWMSISPDLLRYFTSFQSNKDIIRYLSTCTLLHRQRNLCVLHQVIPYQLLKPMLLAGFYTKKVWASRSDCDYVLQSKLLQQVKELTLHSPCRYPMTVIQPQLPESIQSVHIHVDNYFEAFGFQMFPPSLTALYFHGTFNQPIAPGSLPPRLQILECCDMFNQEIVPGSLPNSITHLYFGYCFTKSISAKNLPTELVQLISNAIFCPPERSIILEEMQYLTRFELRWKNYPISKLRLPKSLTHLYLGTEFCGPLDAVPANVTHIKVAFSFPFDLYPVPDSIQKIEFYPQDSWSRW